MSPAWLRVFSRNKGKALIEFSRQPRIDEIILGFVIDISPNLVLLHRLDWSTFRMDGYCALRLIDVKDYRLFDRKSWPSRAIQKLKIRSKKPGKIRLQSWPELIEDAARLFPLLTFRRERKFPDACWIGVPLTVTSSLVTYDDLDPKAKWSGPYCLKMREITRIDFDAGYERALALTAPRLPAKKLRRS
jgi:hypothetical protein